MLYRMCIVLLTVSVACKYELHQVKVW